MDPQKRAGALLVLTTGLPYAEAVTPLYDPRLCYILDGFLLLYGVFITGMFVRERFFKPMGSAEEESVYTDLKDRSADGGYGHLQRPRDPESGRGGHNDNDTYTRLNPKGKTDDTYNRIEVKNDRRRNKNEQVYQDLSKASKDTYDSLQMQPLPPR